MFDWQWGNGKTCLSIPYKLLKSVDFLIVHAGSSLLLIYIVHFEVPITWMQGLPGGTNAAVRDQWIAQSVQRSVGQNANTATGDIASTSATQWTHPLSLKQRLAGLQSKNERMKVGKKVSSDCLLTKGPNKNSSKGSKCICIRTTRKKLEEDQKFTERRWEKSWTTCTYVHCVFSLTFYSSNPFVSLKIQPANHKPFELSRTFLRPPSVVFWVTLPWRHWPLELRNISHVQLRSVGCWWCPGCATLRVRHPPGRVIHITGKAPEGVPEKTNLNVKHHSKTVAWIDLSISFGDVFT